EGLKPLLQKPPQQSLELKQTSPSTLHVVPGERVQRPPPQLPEQQSLFSEQLSPRVPQLVESAPHVLPEPGGPLQSQPQQLVVPALHDAPAGRQTTPAQVP